MKTIQFLSIIWCFNDQFEYFSLIFLWIIPQNYKVSSKLSTKNSCKQKSINLWMFRTGKLSSTVQNSILISVMICLEFVHSFDWYSMKFHYFCFLEQCLIVYRSQSSFIYSLNWLLIDSAPSLESPSPSPRTMNRNFPFLSSLSTAKVSSNHHHDINQYSFMQIDPKLYLHFFLPSLVAFCYSCPYFANL